MNLRCATSETRTSCSRGDVRTYRHGDGKLATKTFISDDHGFATTSTLVMGKEKCILFDAQWNMANGYRVLAEIIEEDLELEAIFLSHSHPDHCFGMNAIKQHFPNCHVYMLPWQMDVMKKQWEEKIDVMLDDKVVGNGHMSRRTFPPRDGHNVIEPFEDDVIMLEGERLELIHNVMGDLRYNSVMWIPSIKTLLGTDVLINNSHIFVCEVTKEERAEWLKALDYLEGLNAEVIIPGHMRFGEAFDNTCIEFTREYLKWNEQCLEKCNNYGEYFFEMMLRFPDAVCKRSNFMNSVVMYDRIDWTWRDDELDNQKSTMEELKKFAK